MMSEQDMENINYGDESDHDLIFMEMLEDIRDGSHTHLNVNRIEARYKIIDIIRQDNWNKKRSVKRYAKHGERFTQGI